MVRYEVEQAMAPYADARHIARWLEVARTDHEIRFIVDHRPGNGPDLLSQVLSITVKSHDDIRIQLLGNQKSGSESGTLAMVDDVPNHNGSRIPSNLGRLVG